MMHWFGDGGGWWAWLAMTLLMVAFWGFVIWAVVTLVRGAERSTTRGTAGREPEQILAERYARGEIDAAEYERRLTTLRGEKTAA